jgi:hypothetical protein
MRANMGSDEEFANGRGCFKFVLAPVVALAVLLARAWGGRRRA